MSFKDWTRLIIWIAMFEAIGFLLGMMTQANLQPWYEGLTKSSFTLPGAVFAIVWSFLYALLAIVGWIIWEKRDDLNDKKLIPLYFMQLIMNWAWTPLFFQLHWLGFSFLWILIMIGLTSVIILRVKNVKNEIALALIPYLLWLIFAAYLNGVIWVFN